MCFQPMHKSYHTVGQLACGVCTQQSSSLHMSNSTISRINLIPSYSEVIPGDYGFKVSFKSPQSAGYTYSDATKLLCINKVVEVAAIFTFEARPPRSLHGHLSIRTLVCCKNDTDILKLGPVKRCPNHVDKGSSKGTVYMRGGGAVYYLYTDTPLHFLRLHVHVHSI